MKEKQDGIILKIIFSESVREILGFDKKREFYVIFN